jgi:gliding-associated putative ABC transporter substrate-binding component GldG
MKKTDRLINLLSLVLIVIFANLLAERYFFTWDFTDSKIYSLSKATKELIKGIDDTVTVKVLFSKDIPYPYSTNTRYVFDLLNDYRMFSAGKIRIDVVDPTDKVSFEEAARLYRIPPVQVNAIENDQIQIKKVFMGIAFIHGERIETIPVVSEVTQLEYEISSTLKNLLTEEKETVAFLSGHGEKPFFRLKELLERNYNVKTINLKDDELKDISLLVIGGPVNKFSEEELLAIDQFVLKGGKTLFLVDRVQADFQYGFGHTIETGLEDLLKAYGVMIKPSLVYDLSAGMIDVSHRRGGFIFTTFTRYPFFPKIVNFNRQSIITKDIETITLGYASPIEIEEKDTTRTTVLARTTEHSGTLDEPFYVAIDRRFRATDFSGPSEAVAVMVSGRFRSMFTEDENVQKDEEFVKEGESRLIVVSDSDFASDELITAPGNAQFVMNAIDWLTEDDALITIRSKRVESRPIRPISPVYQRILKYAIILIPPLLAIFTGITIWLLRRGRKVAV